MRVSFRLGTFCLGSLACASGVLAEIALPDKQPATLRDEIRRTAEELDVLVPELPTRDLAALARTELAAGNVETARQAQATLQKLHLDYAARLADAPAGADALRQSFDTLPQFYRVYEEQPRRETPDAIFAMLQALGPEHMELPLVTPDDQLYNDGAKNTGLWRMLRHSFHLPAKPVKGWLQVYSRGWNHYVNGHDYGWFGGATGDVRCDITADLRVGENLLVIADAYYDRCLVVRGGVLLADGTVVPILSGRGVWEINREPLAKPLPEATKLETMPQAKLTWAAVPAGRYDEGYYRRQPLRWLAMNQIVTLRTQGAVTPWQKPSINGPCRVLFACPQFGQSDVVALAARFDLQVDSLWFGSRDRGVDAAAWNACRDRHYDLLITGNTRLDEKTKNDVMRKVREEGMGLLIVTDVASAPWWSNYLGVAQQKTGKAEDVIQGVPISLLAPFRDQRSPWADLYLADKGRVVIVGYPPGKLSDQIHPPAFTLHSSLLPNTENLAEAEPWQEEYYHAYLGRLAFWAAKRESPIRYELVGPTEMEPAPKPGANVAYRLLLSRIPVGGMVDVVARIRDLDGRPRGTLQVPATVADGRTDTTFVLPALTPGTYVVDLWLKHSAQVLDWYSTLLTVRGDEILGPIRVEAPADGRSRRIRVSCDVKASAADAGDLHLRLEDARFRPLLQVPMRWADGRATAEFAVPAEATALSHCSVERWQKTQRIECRSAAFGLPRPPVPDAFTWVMWPWLPWQRYAELGVDTVITLPPLCSPERLARDMAQYGLRASLFTWRVHDVNLDPTRWTYAERLTFPNFAAFRPYGLAQANLGDDTGIDAFDPGDARYADAFRAFLRRRHGDLATLNRRWQSAYGSWGQIPILTPEQVRKGDATQPALALETRRFLHAYMAESIALVRQRVERHYPNVLAGIEGALFRAMSSVDWETLAPEMGMVCSYPWEWVAELPAFARKDALVGSWTGSYDDFTRDPGQLLQQQWYLLLNGYNSAFHWYASSGVTDSGNTGYVPLFCPDGRLQPEYRDTVQAVRRCKEGLYPLLHHAQVRHDAVGILYSFDSALFLHDEASRGEFPEHGAALRAAWNLLEECGLSPRLVTVRQLADGELAGLGVRALILPSTICLPEPARKALPSFVEKGGTLVADLRPGLRDEYGVQVPPSDSIFALFGYAYEPTRSGKVFGTATLAGKLAPAIPAVCADQGVALQPGSTAAGNVAGVPVWVERTVGKGKTVLLNLSLATYSPPTGWPGQKATYYRAGSAGERALAWRTLMTGMLADAGVRPAAEVLSAGQPSPAVVRLFDNGPVTYVGILRSADFGFGGNREMEVRLPREAHVYDTLSRRYLGKSATIATSPEARQLLLLSCLPYRVTDLKLQPRDKLRRSQPVRFRVDVGTGNAAPADHVIALTRRQPDGTLLPLSQAHMVARNGRGEFTAWFGPEDPAGEWTLIGVDVASGVAGSATVSLPPP